jgi:hypothetical protein
MGPQWDRRFEGEDCFPIVESRWFDGDPGPGRSPQVSREKGCRTLDARDPSPDRLAVLCGPLVDARRLAADIAASFAIKVSIFLTYAPPTSPGG